MHITLETDYAIRIVDLLAKNKNRMDAKTISDSTGVPQTFALKILRKLVADNIVISFKGSKGGYELAENEDLSVYDVVHTMEGDYVFSRCLHDHYNCNCALHNSSLPCAYRSAFARISQQVCEELKKLKFSQLSK